MKRKLSLTLLAFTFFNGIGLFAQECKVVHKDLTGTYAGECKEGYAHGKGQAKGLHQYAGNFKDGQPHGEGIYYFDDRTYYKGKFQDGLKEGKGEMHYLRTGKPDSVIKGYWSGDEYRGKNYITYRYSGGPRFDRVEIEPSANSGKTLTIEVSVFPSDGASVTVTDLYPIDGNSSFIRKLDGYGTVSKSVATYEISKFPISLQVIFSTGQTMNLELYKNARWVARFWILQ